MNRSASSRLQCAGALGVALLFLGVVFPRAVFSAEASALPVVVEMYVHDGDRGEGTFRAFRTGRLLTDPEGNSQLVFQVDPETHWLQDRSESGEVKVPISASDAAKLKEISDQIAARIGQVGKSSELVGIQTHAGWVNASRNSVMAGIRLMVADKHFASLSAERAVGVGYFSKSAPHWVKLYQAFGPFARTDWGPGLGFIPISEPMSGPTGGPGELGRVIKNPVSRVIWTAQVCMREIARLGHGGLHPIRH